MSSNHDFVQKQTEEKNKHLAFYDPLTLLPNRRLLMDRLEQELNYAHRFNTIAAVLLIDVDDINKINTSIGYQYGDDVLFQLAKRLTASLRNSDTVARLEGDEYVIILPSEKTNQSELISHAIKLAEKIQAKCNKPLSH